MLRLLNVKLKDEKVLEGQSSIISMLENWVSKIENLPNFTNSILNMISDWYRRRKNHKFGLKTVNEAIDFLPNSGVSQLIKCKILS